MSSSPFSVNGVGWIFYGRRDFGPDGSFITTEWFIIFHFPIFPLRSYRAISHGRESVVGPFYQKTHYSLSKPMRPNLRQVVSTYLFCYGFVGLMIYLGLNFKALADRFSTPIVVGMLVVALLVFWLLPAFMQGRAMRKAGLTTVRRRRHR
jgi:hypothetical protein